VPTASHIVNVDYHQAVVRQRRGAGGGRDERDRQTVERAAARPVTARRTMSASEAARRMGVKRETVYAYVSRGVLTSHRGPDGRRSRFDVHEVEALARRGRPRRSSRSAVFEIQIETGLTAIDGHRLRFRGFDAIELSSATTFEQAAELLWSGALPAHYTPWPVRTVGVETEGGGLDRIRIAVARAGAGDSTRTDLRPAAVACCGRALISAVVDALPVVGSARIARLRITDAPPLPSTIAARLWTRLTPARPQSELVAVLNAALVLLIDHELAASTLAARVAASVRADPYAVIGAGLGPLSGVLHGGASRVARTMLADARARVEDLGMARAASVAVETARGRHGAVPGFGQPLYPDGDPRAGALLGMLRECTDAATAMALSDAIVREVQGDHYIHPNIDYALATFGLAAGMAADAGEVIFAVARTAGWLAHAMEEYGMEPARFRPRASYVPAVEPA
jgi:citrate synthase